MSKKGELAGWLSGWLGLTRARSGGDGREGGREGGILHSSPVRSFARCHSFQMSFFISSLNEAKRGRVARAHFLDDCLPAAAVVWNCGWYEAEEKEDVARRDVALWRRCLVRFGTFYRFEKSVTPYSLPRSLPPSLPPSPTRARGRAVPLRRHHILRLAAPRRRCRGARNLLCWERN